MIQACLTSSKNIRGVSFKEKLTTKVRRKNSSIGKAKPYNQKDKYSSLEYFFWTWKRTPTWKWNPAASEISTPPEIDVAFNFHVLYGSKTTLIFLPADGEASWLLIPSLVYLLSSDKMQPENTYSFFKATGQVWEW